MLQLTDVPATDPVLGVEAGPGPVAAAGHLARYGNGSVTVDRWPDPLISLVRVGDNVLLRGAVDAVTTDQLAAHVTGWVDASREAGPALHATSERFVAWERLILALDDDPPNVPTPPGFVVRRLVRGDEEALRALDPDLAWVISTWPSIRRLLDEQMAWGAFDGGTLVSVACTFFCGRRHEDLGVVTAEAFRRQGLSAAAAAGLCRDVRIRGRRPSWTTWRENEASRGTARRLGFRHHHDRPVFLVGIDPPE
jgi:GNAT superfamily N-acetyltransferase